MSSRRVGSLCLVVVGLWLLTAVGSSPAAPVVSSSTTGAASMLAGPLAGSAGVRDHLADALGLLRKAQDAPVPLRGQLLARAFDAASAAETPLLDQIDAANDPGAVTTAVRRLSEQVAGLQAGIAKAIVLDRWAQGKYGLVGPGAASVADPGRPGDGRLTDGTRLSFPTTRVGAESGMSHVPQPSSGSRSGPGDGVGPVEAGGVSVSGSGVATPAGSVSTDPGLPTAGNIPTVPTSPSQAGAEACQTAPDVCAAHPNNACCFGAPLPLNATTMIATYVTPAGRHYAACVIDVFADAPNGPYGDYSLVSSGGGSNCNPSGTGSTGQNVATYIQSGMYDNPPYSTCPDALSRGGRCPLLTLPGWSGFYGGIVSNYPLYYSRTSATATQQAQSWISLAIQSLSYSTSYDNRWTYIPQGCTGQGSPNGNNTAQGMPPIINCNIASPPFAFVPDEPNANYYEGVLLSTIYGLVGSYLDYATTPDEVLVGSDAGCGTPAADTGATVPGGRAAGDAGSLAAEDGYADPTVNGAADATDAAPTSETPAISDPRTICADREQNSQPRFHRSVDCTFSNRTFTPRLSSSGTILTGETAPFCDYVGSSVSIKINVCLQRRVIRLTGDSEWQTVADACRTRSFRGFATFNMALTVKKHCRSSGIRDYRTIMQATIRTGGYAAPRNYTSPPDLNETCVI